MDQNLMESTEALLNYINNVYEKSILNSTNETMLHGEDTVNARNNSTLRNVSKRYKRVNTLLQKLKSELSKFVEMRTEEDK